MSKKAFCWYISQSGKPILFAYGYLAPKNSNSAHFLRIFHFENQIFHFSESIHQKKYNKNNNSAFIALSAFYVKWNSISLLWESSSSVSINMSINIESDKNNANEWVFFARTKQPPQYEYTRFQAENPHFSISRCFELSAHIPYTKREINQYNGNVEALRKRCNSCYHLLSHQIPQNLWKIRVFCFHDPPSIIVESDKIKIFNHIIITNNNSNNKKLYIHRPNNVVPTCVSM